MNRNCVALPAAGEWRIKLVKLALVPLLLQLYSTFATTPAWSLPESGNRSTDAKQLKSLRKAEFQVGGASCVVCLRKIEHRLRQSPGVFKAEVSTKRPYQAVVFFDESKTDPHLVWMPLGKDGYTMNDLKVTPVTAVPEGLIFDAIKQPKKTDDMTVSPPPPVAD